MSDIKSGRIHIETLPLFFHYIILEYLLNFSGGKDLPWTGYGLEDHTFQSVLLS